MGSVVQAGGVAVVTGGTQGIGEAAAKHFTSLGLSVCLVDLAGQMLDAAAHGIPGVIAIPADL